MIEKERALCDTLASFGSVVVAYSGGVDSAYLALMAARTLGDRAVAVTAEPIDLPRGDDAAVARVAFHADAAGAIPAAQRVEADAESPGGLCCGVQLLRHGQLRNWSRRSDAVS